MYARMAFMSSPSKAIGLPFIERWKQSFTRCCNEMTAPLRARYSGNAAVSPTHGAAYGVVPPFR